MAMGNLLDMKVSQWTSPINSVSFIVNPNPNASWCTVKIHWPDPRLFWDMDPSPNHHLIFRCQCEVVMIFLHHHMYMTVYYHIIIALSRYLYHYVHRYYSIHFHDWLVVSTPMKIWISVGVTVSLFPIWSMEKSKTSSKPPTIVYIYIYLCIYIYIINNKIIRQQNYLPSVCQLVISNPLKILISWDDCSKPPTR